MKKIFQIITVLALASFCFASCDKNTTDEEELIQEKALAIVKSDVLFQAAAATGTVEVKASSSITAECSAEWCSVSVNSNIVSVTVTENPSLQGRSAVLTIKCGGDSVETVIQQTGFVFSLECGNYIKFNDDASQNAYAFKCNVDVKFETDCPWIQASSSDGKLNIDVEANNSGNYREGKIRYYSDTSEGEIEISQFDIDKDFLGAMRMYYYNTSGSYVYQSITVDSRTINLSSGLKIPYEFDELNMRFIVHGGASLGTVSEKDYYMTFWDTDKGYLSWTESIRVSFPLGYNAEGGYMYAPLTDCGDWVGYNITALRPNQFTEWSETTKTRGSSYYAYIQPMLVRFDQ